LYGGVFLSFLFQKRSSFRKEPKAVFLFFFRGEEERKQKKKAAIEREESDARINYPEREQARPKVKPKTSWLGGRL
jgi:hypothetical protein